MIKKSILLALLSLTMACGSSKITPSKVTVQKVNEQNATLTGTGLTYSLPKTAIRVELEVEQQLKKVGPFYRYSQKLLNITDVIAEDKEEWSIKNIRIYTVGIPDKENSYHVSFEGDNIAPFINLSPEGLIMGVNMSEVPACSSTLKNYDYPQAASLETITFDSVPYLEKQLVKTSTAAMAEEAANLIYKVRKRRLKLLSSDLKLFPPDGLAYELAFNELNLLEKQYMELFAGKTITTTSIKTFDVIPNQSKGANDVLFRFSTSKGVVDKMDVSGTPVYLDWKVVENNELPQTEDKKKDKTTPTGLFYCLPGKVVVKIIDRNLLLKEQEVKIAQYGRTLCLPVELLERNDLQIEMEPSTGALKNIRPIKK